MANTIINIGQMIRFIVKENFAETKRSFLFFRMSIAEILPAIKSEMRNEMVSPSIALPFIGKYAIRKRPSPVKQAGVRIVITITNSPIGAPIRNAVQEPFHKILLSICSVIPNCQRLFLT